jgi:hypothetical protein
VFYGTKPGRGMFISRKTLSGGNVSLCSAEKQRSIHAKAFDSQDVCRDAPSFFSC